MAKYSDLDAFLSVAEHLSFQKAAASRGVTRSALSHSIRSLESDLEVRLLNRNTRSLSLTEPGKLLAERLRPAFANIDEAVDDLGRFRGNAMGTVRLTVPRAVGVTLMGPVLATLARNNPGLAIDVSSDDGLVDIVDKAFDAGIRFGETLQQDVIAAKINYDLHFAVVASPAYFKDREIPQSPADLYDHDCIRYRFPSGRSFPWEFQKNGEMVKINARGPIQLDDQELMTETALAGAGIAFVFAERVQAQLDAGTLIRCLADWTPKFGNLFIYYPSRKFVSSGLRALIDLLHCAKLKT